MKPVNLPPIADLVDLVRLTDEDAEHRLTLVARAESILYGSATSSEDERLALVDKFERWRYQRLNKYSGQLSANDRRLIAVLDVAASKLLHGYARSPKAPRTAIDPGESFGNKLKSQSSGSVEFEAALDPQIPLEEIEREAAVLTRRHFRCSSPNTNSQSSSRWRMRLYAPLYLSNYCVNHCLYCAFRFPNELDRVHLTLDEAIAEAELLRSRGHQHLLVVAGDFPKLTSTDYLSTIVRELVRRGFSVAVEVAAQSTVSYSKLVGAGAYGVTLYQETYQEELYARFHRRGPKIWFDWRLEAPERAAEAGMKRLGLGILLGLADPSHDVRCLIRHGQYLLQRFPAVKLAFSLPRIHEAPDGFKSGIVVDDETFIRLYCALRFSFPTAELVLSTREPPSLRNQLARVCITQMSAGSCTAPGGYTRGETASNSRDQFPIFDHRTPAQMALELEQSGFDLRWDARDDHA